MKQRILTGVIAAAVFLPLVIFGKLPFTLLVYAIGILALFELLRMKGLKLISAPGIISLLLLAVLLYPSQYAEDAGLGITKGEVVFLAVLLLLAYTVLSKNSFTFDEAAFVALAAVYIGFGFITLLKSETSDSAMSFLQSASSGQRIPALILSERRLESGSSGLKSALTNG